MRRPAERSVSPEWDAHRAELPAILGLAVRREKRRSRDQLTWGGRSHERQKRFGCGCRSAICYSPKGGSGDPVPGNRTSALMRSRRRLPREGKIREGYFQTPREKSLDPIAHGGRFRVAMLRRARRPAPSGGQSEGTRASVVDPLSIAGRMLERKGKAPGRAA